MMTLVELVSELVNCHSDSPGCGSKPIADLIANICEESGFVVSVYPYSSGKVNIVAAKGGQAKPSLALAGHMDTVPTDPTSWDKRDPYTVTEGRGPGNRQVYYGLGIADMKLFLAQALLAGARIQPNELTRPFALYFTSEEEVGCVGAKQLVGQNGFEIAQSVVVGEPTGLVPFNCHKGYIYFRVSLKRQHEGKGQVSAHSSDDRTASNIFEVALPPVIAKLREIRLRLREINDERFDPPYPTMNHSGKLIQPPNAAKNVIPGEVSLDCDLRYLPNQDPGELVGLLQRALTTVTDNIKTGIAQEEILVSVKTVRSPTPPLATAAESLIVQATLELSRYTQPETACFNTEGGIYNAAGAESVVWGPGSIAQAHKPNEYVDAAYLQAENVDRLVSLIRRFCC